MEGTPTCKKALPYVPRILEPFRSSGADPRVGGRADKNGTGGRDGETMGNGAEYSPALSDKSINQTTMHGNSNTVQSNASASDDDLPSLTSLNAAASNPNHNIHPLQKGKTSFGCGVHQDVVIEGAGISDQHCYIVNEGQIVTFYPLSVLNSVDGFRVTKPTKLSHGSVLCFGHSFYFRFNHPPQKVKTVQKIVIKGSSPDDENRQRLIKLQSKPSAQEVSVTKSNFPVPDPSQFSWVDLDKELGLKPSAPIELKVSSSVYQLSEAHNTPQLTVSHIRPVRNSLPSSSQSWETRLSRGRFPSQGLEIYPKENSECESPSATFLSSPPHFLHDPKNSTSQNPRPVIDRKCRRQSDEDSDSGAHLTETSSLSSSSHSSVVKLSLIDHVSLNSHVQDHDGPHRTGLNVVSTSVLTGSNFTSTVTTSPLDSSASDHLGRISGAYDNVFDIRTAIISAATAKLANSPLATTENIHPICERPKSLQLSIVSQPDSSTTDACRATCSKNSDSTEAATGSERCIADGSSDQCVKLIDASEQGDSGEQLFCSESRCKELFNGESASVSEYGVKPDCNQLPAEFHKVEVLLVSKPSSSSAVNEVLFTDKENVAAIKSCDGDSGCIPVASNGKSPAAGSIESSNSTDDGHFAEDLSFLNTNQCITDEKNSFELITESPLAEDCSGANVCSHKPPIGKSVPDVIKNIKTEHKGIKSDKKPYEPTAASLFRSLLNRSRSPSPKGSVGSNSPSSAKELRAELVNQASISLLLQKETDETIFSSDNSFTKEQDLGERIKPDSEDHGHVVTVKQTDDGEKSSSYLVAESSENPWRVNLRQNLRPNLENFKGEKVFTKDTVTTNVFVGVGLDGSRISPRTSLTGGENSAKRSGAFRTKTAKLSGISDSARDLRSVQSSEQQAHADVDFGYTSDSGISVSRGSGRIGKFCQSKCKKSVTFAEEYCKDSSTREKGGCQLPLGISPTKSQDMDRVVEGRSPTENLPVSENVRTYLEVVDSSWQKGKAADKQTNLSNEGQTSKIKNQSSVCSVETDEIKKSKSKTIDSNELNLLSEFNNNSSSDAVHFDDPKIKDVDERQSVSLDDLDLDDLSASQQDLKHLYQQQRAERLEEQRRAEVEKRRLEEILRMCSEFGVNTDLEKVEKGELKSNADNARTVNSSSSNSEDDAERNTIKRRPDLDKTIPEDSQALDALSLLKLENISNDSRAISTTTGNQAVDEDLSPASPVVDSGIDISTVDRSFVSQHSKEFGSISRDRRPEENQPSLDRPRLVDRRPSDEYWASSEYQPHHSTYDTEYVKNSYSSKRVFHKTWNDEKSKQVQLDLLRELQSDVVRSIASIKQKISDIETRQSEALREVEMERALLEGEQQIQMEQLDRIKEKIISLETKESNLLAESASQRAREVERICLEKEKLLDLERQLHAAKDLASRSTNPVEADALKRRCSEIQDAVDNHRFLMDNLEFQQLEVEAHFEEEKESVQMELSAERAYLDSLSSQHQATLKQIASQQSDLLKQVDFDVFELEKERQSLAELFQKENAVLYNINCQIQDALSTSMVEDDNEDEDVRFSYSNRWHRPRLSETEIETVSRSTHGSPQKLSTKFSHTIPKIDSQRNRAGEEASDDEDRRFLYELKKRSTSRPLWERSCDLPDGGVGEGAVVQWQGAGSSAPTANSESEDSSVSGSDPLSDKAISLSSKEDQLHDMECLLVLAKAERLRLVEEQMHQRDIEREALEQERRRRKVLERRLAEEIAKHNDAIEQAIRLREKEKLQARPLTRYLPVRDRNLDLQQFIVAAGHSVDQCTHLAMTSTSCRGYLTKMGSRIRTWKKRWFVFDRTKRCLSYYGDKSESRPRGVIYFQAIEDVFVDHLHQVKSPTPQLTFCVKTYDRMYYLMAPSPDAMRIWIDVIFTGAEGYQQFA